MIPVVATVNDTVAMIEAAPLALLDSSTEGAVTAALKIAGNTTKLTPSIFVFPLLKVDIVTLAVALVTKPTFWRPVKRHMMELEVAACGVLLTVNIMVSVPILAAAPVKRPEQTTEFNEFEGPTLEAKFSPITETVLM